MTTDAAANLTFGELGLADPVLRALQDVGYEVPTPIQARTIPPLLQGRDVLGQAQTGTGKTAAFALPLLSRIDLKRQAPQVLVLTPTRELAIQVSEAFQRYAHHLSGLHVLPIYGGQDYGVQLKMLKRGVHVVVGTPGRVMDHLRRGTLNLGALSALVLDEADEMLRMGFIDDVEWILGHTPPKRQLALFSATLPAGVKRIAYGHLQKPVEILVKEGTATAALVRQRVWVVSGTHKLDALTRMMEVEPFDAMIVFVRTRNATTELSERLCARGFDAAAIHGDIPQRERERIISRLRSGDLDILVATDVAARGLDVERVSHVINFDIPHDSESYVHRIGRTGRAGRSGEAILFVAPRERHMLRTIERATGQRIEVMELPTHADINDVRVKRFFDNLTRTLAEEDLSDIASLLERYQLEHAVDPLLLAAAVAHQAQGNTPLLLKSRSAPPRREATEPRPAPPASHDSPPRRRRERQEDAPELFRIEVGRAHGTEPRNIVGAIVNEAGLEPRHVGRVELFDDYSLVELPAGMPQELLAHLKTVWVSGRQLLISRAAAGAPSGAKKFKRPAAKTDPGPKGKGGPKKRRKDNAADKKSKKTRKKPGRSE